MSKSFVLGCFFIFLLSSWNLAQDKNKPQLNPKVDQDKIDKAIEKGVAYLKSANIQITMVGNHDPSGLFLLTFIHAGVSEDDATFKQLLDNTLTKELKTTYQSSLYAMALESLDKKKYQWRIAQCAQFLVDNQCENGQWDYGQPVKLEDPKFKPVETPGNKNNDIGTGTDGQKSNDKSGDGQQVELPKPQDKKTTSDGRPEKKIPVSRRGKGRPTGDNSNSQYAALGLRACYDAGINMPSDVFRKAKTFWESHQQAGGGWSYDSTGIMTAPLWGSMTAGAAGSLCIYNYLLGQRSFKNDPKIKAGIEWVTKNFTVSENANIKAHPIYKDPRTFFYYYLYALERSGILYGTEYFGGHEWYPEGAKFILSDQKNDGSWISRSDGQWGSPQSDTCFAILFLRRATKPLKPPKEIDTER